MILLLVYLLGFSHIYVNHSIAIDSNVSAGQAQSIYYKLNIQVTVPTGHTMPEYTPIIMNLSYIAGFLPLSADPFGSITPEDSSDNITRFLVIGKYLTRPTGDDKTSILFAVKDRVGALHDMLVPFKKNKINLTKIESRPSKKKPWEYYFFVDIQGHKEDAKIKKLAALQIELGNIYKNTHPTEKMSKEEVELFNFLKGCSIVMLDDLETIRDNHSMIEELSQIMLQGNQLRRQIKKSKVWGK